MPDLHYVNLKPKYQRAKTKADVQALKAQFERHTQIAAAKISQAVAALEARVAELQAAHAAAGDDDKPAIAEDLAVVEEFLAEAVHTEASIRSYARRGVDRFDVRAAEIA